MSKHASLPYHHYVKVDNKYLGPNMPIGTTNAIWHGVYGREYQVLLCHVVLETGAHWSGLPLQAMSMTDDFSLTHEELMPWKCMGERIDVFSLDYLHGLKVKTRAGVGRHTGVMVDWKDGYSEYPQEHKPLNLVALDSGQFSLSPNNYCVFEDKHFVSDAKKDELKLYLRGEDIYWE
jgi:hypothetical protein